MNSISVGIDLGTTYSCVGVFRRGAVEIIANDHGNRITPSYVAFTDAEQLVGESAKEQIIFNPENTVYDAKRLIGRRFNDQTVQEDKKHWGFKIINEKDYPKIQVTYMNAVQTYFPQKISSMVLNKMKETAESYLGKIVKDVVITVPAYFNDSQRRSTKDAAEIVGLNVLRIINEPTAAAIAYGMDNKDIINKNVLIYDLGGGTFDVAILNIKKGKITVIATDGNTHLGGEDFDNRMVCHLMKEFKQKHGKDISNDKSAIQKLKKKCELAKRTLSTSVQARIIVEYLCGDINFSTTLFRARFEDICSDLFQETIDIVKRCLQQSNLNKSQIDELVIVGGSTRIPMIQTLLRNFFNGKELNKSIHVDEAVAYGAAVLAAQLSENNKSIDIQKTLFTLVDVTPLSLGIGIKGGITSVIINRNTQIPVKITKSYVTSENNQTEIYIAVYEGERTMNSDNNLLGKLSLTGIPPLPEGEATCDVTFSIDLNSILTVTAKNMESGNWKEITITENGSLSKSEMKKMIDDAKINKEEDDKRKANAAAKNSLESLINEVNRELLNGNLRHNEHVILERKCKELMTWIEKNQSAKVDEYENQRTQLERTLNKAKQ